uniref:Uncharacterized protein n=1 Tax=Pararge aegeria TaxID=116150 RepID=S4PYZ8_9NEOP
MRRPSLSSSQRRDPSSLTDTHLIRAHCRRLRACLRYQPASVTYRCRACPSESPVAMVSPAHRRRLSGARLSR